MSIESEGDIDPKLDAELVALEERLASMKHKPNPSEHAMLVETVKQQFSARVAEQSVQASLIGDLYDLWQGQLDALPVDVAPAYRKRLFVELCQYVMRKNVVPHERVAEIIKDLSP